MYFQIDLKLGIFIKLFNYQSDLEDFDELELEEDDDESELEDLFLVVFASSFFSEDFSFLSSSESELEEDDESELEDPFSDFLSLDSILF